MTPNRSLSGWLKARRQQALIAVLGIALAVTLYLVVDGRSSLGSLVQDLSISVIFAAVAYLFANYILYSDELAPSQIYQRIGEIVKDKGLREVVQHAPAIDWNGFLNEPPAMAVEGFVRYLDAPLDGNREAFVDFFARGGRLTLVLPDEDNAIATNISRQFDPDNPIQPGRILERIAATRTGLASALSEAEKSRGAGGQVANGNSQLKILTATQAPNYWALTADRRRAFFAPYDNWARSGRRMPVFEFDLAIATELSKCIDNEMRRFKE